MMRIEDIKRAVASQKKAVDSLPFQRKDCFDMFSAVLDGALEKGDPEEIAELYEKGKKFGLAECHYEKPVEPTSA